MDLIDTRALHHPTGKAMHWGSESSDEEEATGQRFRRRETQMETSDLSFPTYSLYAAASPDST
uniref:GG11912 n=1 Tax=Drosophila erecta TaxID=7220 RepID=B3P247_DROER